MFDEYLELKRFYNLDKCACYRQTAQKLLFGQCCSVLAISDLGAKHDFEIWAFKVFFFGQEKHPLEWLLEAQT